jgi:hypothetical protein
VNDDPREFVFTRYEARHGLVWLTQAYALFSRKRLPWVLLLLAYYAMRLLLLWIPLIGPYAMTVLKPVFAVGLLAAAWTQERGGTPSLNQLFQGFRANLGSLLPIGIFVVAGITAAVFASSLVDGGKLLELLSNAGAMSNEEIAAAVGDPSLQFGMIFSALLSIPIMIATWWAPALVVFQNARAGAALVTSLRAALANWRPLVVYGIGVTFFGVVIPAIFTGILALIIPGAGMRVAEMLLLPYGIFLAATLHISDYISYREVFHSGETLAPLSGLPEQR